MLRFYGLQVTWLYQFWFLSPNGNRSQWVIINISKLSNEVKIRNYIVIIQGRHWSILWLRQQELNMSPRSILVVDPVSALKLTSIVEIALPESYCLTWRLECDKTIARDSEWTQCSRCHLSMRNGLVHLKKKSFKFKARTRQSRTSVFPGCLLSYMYCIFQLPFTLMIECYLINIHKLRGLN